jgi:hypothetical protein
MRIRTNTATKVVFFFFALGLFCAACRKSTQANSSGTQSQYNPASRMAGIWGMRGTYDYLAPGIVDSVNTNIEIWVPDSATIVVFDNDPLTFPDYSVYTMSVINGPAWSFGDYVYAVTSDTLKYNMFLAESGNYQTETLSSVSHTRFTNASISATTAKVTGMRTWHGSDHFTSTYPSYDTTYYNTIQMQISALADTLIMVKTADQSYPSGWRYMFLGKAQEDPTSMVFLNRQNTGQGIVYYFGINSMFYFDTSNSYPYGGSRYYTP